MLSTPTPAKERSWSVVACAAVRCRVRPVRAHVLEASAMSNAPDAPEIVRGSGDDVDRRVGVVGPLDRRLADPHPEPFGCHEELGVEKPLVVLDERQDLQRPLAPDGLEAALEVGEAGSAARARTMRL